MVRRQPPHRKRASLLHLRAIRLFGAATVRHAAASAAHRRDAPPHAPGAHRLTKKCLQFQSVSHIILVANFVLRARDYAKT